MWVSSCIDRRARGGTRGNCWSNDQVGARNLLSHGEGKAQGRLGRNHNEATEGRRSPRAPHRSADPQGSDVLVLGSQASAEKAPSSWGTRDRRYTSCVLAVRVGGDQKSITSGKQGRSCQRPPSPCSGREEREAAGGGGGTGAKTRVLFKLPSKRRRTPRGSNQRHRERNIRLLEPPVSYTLSSRAVHLTCPLPSSTGDIVASSPNPGSIPGTLETASRSRLRPWNLAPSRSTTSSHHREKKAGRAPTTWGRDHPHVAIARARRPRVR